MGSVQSSYAHAEDGCPVDHKNMSEDEISQMMEQYKKMGNSNMPMKEHPTVPKSQSEPSHMSDHPADAQPSPTKQFSGCPVDHTNMSKEQIAAYMAKHTPPEANQEDTPNRSTVYDVYGQELDRSNMMPATPNQLPSPGQEKPLSTDRVKSNIPKSGENETWTYPSPQMFYNALKRKGKADGVEESDMNTVVNVHNTMNERTWREVMQWERKYHCSECENPKLKSFVGRPHDLSPAARFRTWFRAYPMPFDRHDWIIDRCGEQDARYVIDYYYRDRSDPIEIHVRPALDSFSAALDRIRSGLESIKEAALSAGVGNDINGTVERQAELSKHTVAHIMTGDRLDKSEFDFLSSLTPGDINDIAEDVQMRCAKVSEAFREAGDDPQLMEKANVSVNYCMAQRICKPQAVDFMSALENGTDETDAYGKMTACLERFHIMARRAILEEAGVVQSGPEFPAGVTPSISSSRNPASASSVE